MAEISQSKKNAQEKLENLFVKATTDFRKWLQAVGKPDALFKILKEVVWSLQFAAAPHSEAVVTLWFDLMVLMRTTRYHPIREWTYEVLAEFTSMQHLIDIVAKHSGFCAFQLELYGLDANPIVVSSGAKTVIETMLVRLALCISQRFPEHAATILLDYKAAEMISKMIGNEVLSKEFRREVSKRYLKLCNFIKKQVENSRPPQHQRVNQLRNSHEYHSYLRHQQHQKHSHQLKHPPVEEQQLVPKGIPPQAQSHHVTRPQNQEVSGEQQWRVIRPQKTPKEIKAQTAPGLDVEEQHPKQSQQKKREGQRQQTTLEKSSAHQVLKTQQLNPQDKHLLKVFEEEERSKKMREAEQELQRQWEFEPFRERFLLEVQLHKTRINPAVEPERKALEQETPINEELDSLLGELHRVCFQDIGKQEIDSSAESQKQELQNSTETTQSEQQKSPTAEQQRGVEEPKISSEEPALGSQDADSDGKVELPGVEFKSEEPLLSSPSGPPPKRESQESATGQSSRQEPSYEGEFRSRKSPMRQEPQEPAGESKLMKLFRKAPQPPELWPEALLHDRDRILEFQNELIDSLESQKRQHEQLVKAAALKYKLRLEKLRSLHARLALSSGHFGPQPAMNADFRLNRVLQEITLNSHPKANRASMLDAAPKVRAQPQPRFERARPLQEWQLPCEELILLQMRQGRLYLPPAQAEKYSRISF